MRDQGLDRRSLSLHIIAFGVFSALCYFGSTVIVTVVLAILAAYILDPLVHLMVRFRFPRPGLSLFFFFFFCFSPPPAVSLFLFFVFFFFFFPPRFFFFPPPREEVPPPPAG